MYSLRYAVYGLQERNSAVVVLLPDEAGWRSKDVRVFADEISFFNQVKSCIVLHCTLPYTPLYCTVLRPHLSCERLPAIDFLLKTFKKKVTKIDES
jgi:hypothetical protein